MPKTAFLKNNKIKIMVSLSKFSLKSLNEAEFSSMFSDLWDKLHHCFFKFERLQAYEEPNDPSYQAFIAGDLKLALKHLEERIAQQATLYNGIAQKNINLIRVRAVELPLSDYLQYEFKSYQLSAKYGERILIIDITNPNDNIKLELSNLTDFLLFDDYAVLIHKYNKNGLFQGGWLADKPNDIEFFLKISQEAIKISIPLGTFEKKMGLL